MGWIERREQEIDYRRQQDRYDNQRGSGGPMGTLFLFVIIVYVIYSAIRAYSG